MSDFGPDFAAAKWQEDKEEIGRLKQHVADRDATIDEHLRRIAELEFQVAHWKEIADAKGHEADFYYKWVAEYQARFSQISDAASHIATQIVAWGSLANKSAGVRPQPAVIATDNPAVSVEEAAARVEALLSASPVVIVPEDDGEAIPALLTAGPTPLPEVRP